MIECPTYSCLSVLIFLTHLFIGDPVDARGQVKHLCTPLLGIKGDQRFGATSVIELWPVSYWLARRPANLVVMCSSKLKASVTPWNVPLNGVSPKCV